MMKKSLTATPELSRGRHRTYRGYIVRTGTLSMLLWSVLVLDWSSIAWSQVSSEAVPSSSTGASLNESSVQVMVNHSVGYRPTKIRLMMKMQAESRQLETSLTDLKDHIKIVRKEVSGLDAIESSIRVNTPTIKMGTPGIDNPEEARKSIRSQQMMQARMMRAAGGGRNMLQPAASESELPIIYTSTTYLVADWLLPKEPSDELSLLPARLFDKAKDQDWAGKNLRAELNDEEQAAVDELASPSVSSSIIYAGLQSNPEIQFIYLAEISQAEKAEGLHLASQNATDQLAAIAKQLNKTLKRTLVSQIRPPLGFPGTTTSITTFAPQLAGQASHRQIYVADNELGSLDPDGLVRVYSVAATGAVD